MSRNIFLLLKHFAVLILLMTTVLSAHAQTDTLKKDTVKLKEAVDLKNVVVFGYSTTQKTNRQAYNVTAIDARKLHNSSTDIAATLDRVSGTRLRQSGGVGSDFNLSINGFSGNRIRFFLDGIPMDNFGPSFQINNIPINFAERIEVYKGVVPVWLGSDALGGAVNIVSGNGMKNYLDASYSYGSFNTHRSNINAAFTSKNGFTVQLNAFQNYSDNDYKVTVDAADVHTGKYYPEARLRRFNDKYHNETAILQAGFRDQKWADQFLVGITLGQYYKEIQNGARLTSVFGGWHTKGNIVMPTLKYRKKDLLLKGLDVIVNANYNLGRDQNIDTVHARYGWLGDSIRYQGRGGERSYQNFRYRNNSANGAATINYSFDEKHMLSLNNVFTYFNRKGSDVLFINERRSKIPQYANKNILGLSYQYAASDKWNTTVFAKYLYQYSKTELISTGQSAADTIYTPASATTNKLGYGMASTYFVTPEMQLKFSYERSNRLPENEDIFGDLINREANWDLLPERSDNLNLGLSYLLKLQDNHRLNLSATGIYNHAKDYIYLTFNTNETKIIAQNLDGVSNLGFEAEVRYSYKTQFAAGLNATYQNVRNKQKHLPNTQIVSDLYEKRIPNIPYLFGNADASIFLSNVLHNNDKLSIGYNLLYVHKFFLYWGHTGSSDSKYFVPRQIGHDANIVYTTANGKYNIAFECRNFSNSLQYDNFSLQKPGRAFYLKLRYFISNP